MERRVALLLTFQYFGPCFCCISIWYLAALHPDAPFGPSLLGFVLGVGVAEEITKCIPVLWRIHRQDIDWRGACLLGMASGAGFGISEGVHYCSNFYNGIVPLPSGREWIGVGGRGEWDHYGEPDLAPAGKAKKVAVKKEAAKKAKKSDKPEKADKPDKPDEPS